MIVICYIITMKFDVINMKYEKQQHIFEIGYLFD